MADKLKAAGLSIAVNFALILLKTFVALRTGSLGLLAEVFHSLLDLVASVFAYFGIRKASSPPDYDHPYGHQRFENLSSLAQVILIVITSFLVGYEALQRILHPHAVQETQLGIIVILISMAAAYYTSRKLDSVARKEKSAALESDAFHFTTDVWAGIAVLVGLILVQLGFPLGDPLAAIAVAFVMLFGSFNLGKKSVLVLTDASPDQAILDRIGLTLAADKRITSFHKLRGREAGSKVFIDVHVRLTPNTTLVKGHAVCHEVKKRIMRELPMIEDVSIHLEPEPPKSKRVKSAW